MRKLSSRERVGVLLIAVSYIAYYGLIALILFLPLTAGQKTAGILLVGISAYVLFFYGTYLAGRFVVDHITKQWSRVALRFKRIAQKESKS